MSEEIKLKNEGFEDKEKKRQEANSLSDEQLKQIAIQQSRKGGGYQRPSETISLPSKGILYPEGHPLKGGTIELFHPTARDEDILMTINKIKKQTVLDDFIKAIIATPVNYDDLLICDRDKLLIASRILAYGAKFQAEVTDPDTNEKQEVSIDLNEMGEKEVDFSSFEDGKNLFSFTLPKMGETVEFQLPTVGLNKIIDQKIKAEKQFSKGVDRDMSIRMKWLIKTVGGDGDRKTINEFVDIVPSLDMKELRDYIYSITPGVDTKFNFISDLTGRNFELEVPISSPQFFWPRSRR